MVTDAAAVAACVRFANDHRVLVEPACGAALAPAYGAHPALRAAGGDVVVVVCGGAAVDLQALDGWARQFGVAGAGAGGAPVVAPAAGR